MNNREQTLADMKDNLVRMKALESHAKMFCSVYTQICIEEAVGGLEDAIETEELAEEASNGST